MTIFLQQNAKALAEPSKTGGHVPPRNSRKKKKKEKRKRKIPYMLRIFSKIKIKNRKFALSKKNIKVEVTKYYY